MEVLPESEKKCESQNDSKFELIYLNVKLI